MTAAHGHVSTPALRQDVQRNGPGRHHGRLALRARPPTWWRPGRWPRKSSCSVL